MKELSTQGFIEKHRRPLEALARVREHLQGLAPAHEGPGGPLSTLIGDLVRLSLRLEDRLDWGADAPLIVAVLGATGTGKSKIFNSLIGGIVSPSGFKRPTTMAPVLYLDRQCVPGVIRPVFFPGYEKREISNVPVVFDPEHEMELIVMPTDAPDMNGRILVDTPDFDSVLESNRTAARDIFQRSDGIIFVTDTVKYADQAAWDYLDRIRDRDKAAILIVNRVKNPLSQEDFVRRVREAELDRPVLGLADEPGLGDADLFSPDHETLEEIRRYVKRWTGDLRREMLAGEAFKDWHELDRGINGKLLPQLTRASQTLSAVKAALAEADRQAQDSLAERLTVSISGELKHSLISQIQTQFLRWDLLKYPRKILTLPFTLLKDKVLVPLGFLGGSGRGGGGLDQEIDRLFEANQETMVAVIHEYNRRAARMFAGDPVGRGLAARPEFQSLGLTAARVREAYATVRTELEDWVRAQARELVKGLGLGEKMTFYLAQVVSLGLFISIQVHTGGGFSFFDGLLDSVLAPILSKITGHALSRDKVKAFELQAARLHLSGCRRMIETQAGRYLDFLSGSETGLESSRPLAEAAVDLSKAFESMK